jgi:hypothetical protein
MRCPKPTSISALFVATVLGLHGPAAAPAAPAAVAAPAGSGAPGGPSATKDFTAPADSAASAQAPAHLLITFRAGVAPKPKPGPFRVVRVLATPASSAHNAPHSPGRAVALLALATEPPPLPPSPRTSRAPEVSDLAALAAAWTASHPPAHLDLRRRGDRFELTAAAPNPLGALTAFLATLDLRLDRWGALTTFVGIAIGTETDGASLGIAFHDPDTRAALTVTFLSMQDLPAGPRARFDVQLAPRQPPARLLAPLRDRTTVFARRSGVAIELDLEPLNN